MKIDDEDCQAFATAIHRHTRAQGVLKVTCRLLSLESVNPKIPVKHVFDDVPSRRTVV